NIVSKDEKGGSISLPSHLYDCALMSAEAWARSALTVLTLKENIDYVIKEGMNHQKIIAPVDYDSTGLVKSSLSWSNGVHQFLQLKHSLSMTSENFLTSFISNLSYFSFYGTKIYGMTGTLGFESSKELLKSMYPIELGIIPTY